MKKLYTILLVAFISLSMWANGPEENESESVTGGTLSGTVKDSSTKLPVEYATIGIYSMLDSSLISGTITNESGEFEVKSVPFGEYYVDIRFVGYENTRITLVNLGRENRKLQMGEIPLIQALASLDAVEIVADLNTVEYKIDKKVINVGQDISSAGGTAVDVLQNTPSIQTDIEGNVELRGSSNFTVLIDGKPSVLDGNDVLQQIPASSLLKIEIITNPSAKYDPDGTGGIINLILKKEIMGGLNGILNTSATNAGQYSGDLLLNYRSGKFNIYGGVDYSKRPFPGTSLTNSENYLNDTIYYLDSEGDRSFERGGTVVKAGFDYDLNEKNTISLSGNFGTREFGISSQNRYHQYTFPVTEDIYYFQDNRFEVYNQYYSVDVNYRKSFAREGHNLTAYAFFSSRTGDDRQEIIREFTDGQFNLLDELNGRQQSRETNERTQFRYNLDYVLPFSESSRLEAGIQGRMNGGLADYFFEDYDPDTREWIENNEFSSGTDFSRNIQSIYAMYYGKAGKLFDYQVGLRTEYTYRSIKQVTTNEDNKIDRLDYYPSIFLSKKLPADQQIQLSYSRRVDRPRSWYLDPFPSYIDPLNIRIGNPGLNPEFIDSYQLSYQKRIKRNFFTSEIYYRQTNDKITRIQELRNDGIKIQTFENLNNDKALGVELMTNVYLAKWWDLMASTNIYRYQLTQLERDGGALRETNTFNVRMNSNFKLKWGTMIQLTGFYNGPSISAQGEREGFFSTNIAVRQDFLNRKLNVIFRISDPFGSVKYVNTSRGQNFYTYNEFSRQSPIISLSISYKINNYKQERRAYNGVNEMEFDGGGF